MASELNVGKVTASAVTIYNDGANSFVNNATGQLFINKAGPSNCWIHGPEVGLASADGTETLFRATQNGSVKLYYDNAIKLETSATGLAVTGAVTASSTTTVNADLVVNSTLNTPLIWANTTGTGALLTLHQSGVIKVNVDNAGNLGLGVTPAARLHTLVSGGPNEFRMQAHRGDVGQNLFSALYSRGSSASPGVVVNGDTVLEIQPKGFDGANYHRIAEVDFQVDGVPGTNDMPGRIVFSTTADGASAPTERMRIDSAGLATFANGIAFQSATTGSGTGTGYKLDSYEVGIWTPVIAGGSCTNLVGKYTRVGNKVTVTVSVMSGVLSGITGTLNAITGLPFTVGNTRSMTSSIGFINLLPTGSPIGVVIESSDRIDFLYNNASTSWSGANFANSTGANLHFSATYFV